MEGRSVSRYRPRTVSASATAAATPQPIWGMITTSAIAGPASVFRIMALFDNNVERVPLGIELLFTGPDHGDKITGEHAQPRVFAPSL